MSYLARWLDETWLRRECLCLGIDMPKLPDGGVYGANLRRYFDADDAARIEEGLETADHYAEVAAEKRARGR